MCFGTQEGDLLCFLVLNRALKHVFELLSGHSVMCFWLFKEDFNEFWIPRRHLCSFFGSRGYFTGSLAIKIKFGTHFGY